MSRHRDPGQSGGRGLDTSTPETGGGRTSGFEVQESGQPVSGGRNSGSGCVTANWAHHLALVKMHKG